jgi:ribonuclease Z
MPKLVLLGTATNVPDEKHENTHMVLVGSNRTVLIDGPGNPYARLKMAGLDPNSLTDIFLTHFHPDHASGIPLLLMALGLSGRHQPLNIFANAHCLNYARQVLEFYGWDKWHDFPVHFNTVEEKEFFHVLDDDEFTIFSSPVVHYVPALGLRVEFKGSGKVLAYSGDTAPVQNVVELARDADVLIHEAAGAQPQGHSSALQAGEIAQKAKAKELYLIHYPVGDFNYQTLVGEAQKAYDGAVTMAEDFLEIEF